MCGGAGGGAGCDERPKKQGTAASVVGGVVSGQM